jgi:hypothetical protein
MFPTVRIGCNRRFYLTFSYLYFRWIGATAGWQFQLGDGVAGFEYALDLQGDGAFFNDGGCPEVRVDYRELAQLPQL